MAFKPFTGAKRLRQLLASDELIVCPGVYDGITARLAIAQNFPAIYMTGAGTSMSQLGWADLGLATQTEMVANAAMVASLDPSVPVIADADTGYGGPVMVARTVAAYSRAGIAALHIEDQVQEKRCGHLLGKELVDREVFVSRIAAAAQARDALGSDMLIIARTDARQKLGFDEAVARLRAARDVGADVVFFEAMQSIDEAKRVVETFQGIPCLLNMVPGGVTPDMTAAQAHELGFRIMIWPGITMEAAINAISSELAVLKNSGASSGKKHELGIKHIFDMCGLQEAIEIDKKAGGKAYSTINGSH